MNRSKISVAGAFFIIAAAIITACDKKVGKLPEPVATGAVSCDTITYTKHIKPIIDANCSTSNCHDGTNSNPLLGTYDQFKDRADAGRIQERVIEQKPTSMPPAEKTPLTAAQKKLISCWLDNGKKQ